MYNIVFSQKWMFIPSLITLKINSTEVEVADVANESLAARLPIPKGSPDVEANVKVSLLVVAVVVVDCCHNRVWPFINQLPRLG